jgi:SAM-dependent methyltransferase
VTEPGAGPRAAEFTRDQAQGRAPEFVVPARWCLLRLLDQVLYRKPFEGASAARYAQLARPAFDDFDERLLTRFGDRLTSARRLLEVGAGPAAFARAAKRRFPHLQVIALEPSRDLARAAVQHPRAARDAFSMIRAAAERIPLADGSIDVAVCLSSIRHVADRARAFGELRRVLARDGSLIIAELDPAASARRVEHHADRIDGTLLRLAFGPLVVRTAPPCAAIVAPAIAAGFTVRSYADDPWQPLYLLELQ